MALPLGIQSHATLSAQKPPEVSDCSTIGLLGIRTEAGQSMKSRSPHVYKEVRSQPGQREGLWASEQGDQTILDT